MKKRGSFWNIIISAILVMIILFGTSYFFTTESWKGVRAFLGLGYPEDEKVEGHPIKGCKVPECSMNALICAVNSIALGRPGWLEPNPHAYCPQEGFEKIEQVQSAQAGAAIFSRITGNVVSDQRPTCNGVYYGNSCVECSAEYSLGTKGDKLGLHELSRIAIDCMNRFYTAGKPDMFCGKISKGSIEGTLTQKELKTHLRENEGAEGKKLIDEMYLFVHPSPFDLSRDYFVIADNAGGDSIFFLTAEVIGDKKVNGIPVDIDDAQETYANWFNEYGNTQFNKFNCKANGFELPQQITNWENYIAGFGDPRYLAYYEKFPPEEKAAWEFQKRTWFMVGLGIRGVFVTLPFAKGIVKMIGKTIGMDKISRIQRMTRSLDKLDDVAKQKKLKKIMKLIDDVPDEGLKAFLRTASRGTQNLVGGSVVDDATNTVMRYFKLFKSGRGVVYQQFYKAGSLTDDGIRELADIIRFKFSQVGLDDLATRYADDITRALQRGDDVEDALSAIMRAAPDDIALAAARSRTQLEIMKKVGFSRFAKAALAKNSYKATGKIMRKAFGSIDELRNVDPSLYNKVIGNMDDAAKTLFSKGDLGILMRSSTNLVDNADDILRLMTEGGDEAVGAVLAKMVKPQASTGLIRSSIRTGSEWARRSSKELVKCLAFVPAIMAGGALYFINNGELPAAIAGSAAGVAIQTVTPGIAGPISASAGCINFLRYNYIPFLLATGYAFNREDSQNQVFVPIGINKLGLVEPKEYETEPKIYGLNNLNNLYMNMKKEHGQWPKRFFLASPCKTDLRVTYDYCTCDVMHRDFVYEFQEKGKRIQTIEPIGLEVTPEYAWDSMTEDEKIEFLFTGNIFKEQGWKPKNKFFDRGLAEIWSTISIDADLMKQYFKALFPDAKSFLWIVYQGNPNHPSVIQKSDLGIHIRPILNLDKAGFDGFIDEFVAHYNESQVEGTIVSRGYVNEPFSYSSDGITIDIPRITGRVIDSKFFYPFQHDHLDRDSWIARNEDKEENDHLRNAIVNKIKGYYKQGDISTMPWDDTNKPWDERSMDWNLMANVKEGHGSSKYYYQIEVIKEMTSHRLYHSDFFNDLAKKSAFQTYYVDQSAAGFDKAVKKCTNHVTNIQAPSLSDKDQRLTLKTTVPCISVAPERIMYYKDTEKWNDGNNYCFSGTSPSLGKLDEVMTWASIGIGVGLTFASGGTAGVVVFTGIELASMASAYILEVCGEWPEHAPSWDGCFS